MTKKDIVDQLRKAKSAHIQWRSYAQALIAGIEVKQDHVPVIHTDCRFGTWYYGEGQSLASLSGYAAIEAPHEMLHKIYMDIFKLIFDNTEVGLLGKMFGKQSRIEQRNQEEAEVLLEKMLAVSTTLLEEINLLEKDVLDMPDEEIAALI